MKDFGKILKKERVKLNKTLFEVSINLGIDSAIISKIERGLRMATRKQVILFIQEYQLSEKEAFSYWLADKILYEIGDEFYIKEAFAVAESKINYLSKSVEYPDKIQGLIQKVDGFYQIWSKKKPLDKTQLLKMKEFFNVENTFQSNLIEGNTLTLQETHLVVNEGLTISGKSMNEHLEAINHYEALDYIVEVVQNKVPISERIVKEIHYLILKGIDRKNAGVYRSVPVYISGSSHKPPQPYLLAKMMEELFEFYENNKHKLHPVILAANMHEKLVTIHPFIDGNGRTSRLLMNLLLLKSGYPIISLKGDLESKLNYYKTLEQTQVSENYDPFLILILKTTIESLEQHIELCG